MAGPVQVVDSPLLRQQIEAQRLGIKHLKNENNRLKVQCFGVRIHFDSCNSDLGYVVFLQAETIRAQLASLPPLRPPKLPQMSKDSSMPPEGLNTGIYRRTDQLLATLLKLSAEMKVVDITGKTTGVFETHLPDLSLLRVHVAFLSSDRETSSCRVFVTFVPVSASAQLLEQTARLKNLSDALDKLKVTASEVYLFS